MLSDSKNNYKLNLIKYLISEIFPDEFKPRKKLPSTEWLAIKFKLSKAVVRTVIKQFQSIGWIASKYRSGYFVSNKISSMFYFNYFLNKSDYQIKIIENTPIQNDVYFLEKQVFHNEELIVEVNTIYQNLKNVVMDVQQPLIVNLLHQNKNPTTIEEYIAVEMIKDKWRIVEVYRYHDSNNNLIAVEEYMINPAYYHKEIYTSFK